MAAAAPYLFLYLSYGDQGNEIYDGLLPTFVLIASAVLGSLVFTLLSKARPEWLYGIGCSSAVAILSAVGWGFLRPGTGVRFSFSIAVFVLGLSFLAGMAGASVASLLSRPLLRKRPNGNPKRVRPWHIGGAVLILELVLVGAVTAVRL